MIVLADAQDIRKHASQIHPGTSVRRGLSGVSALSLTLC